MRDIDDWMFHFERQVAVRLKRMFSVDVSELPEALAQRLQLLDEAELKNAPPDGEQKRFKE
ncbi:MAG: hypothetical protein JSR78_00310 [Proteobacteria bacterium]|nr:hypothetical protein [Pseudomonadota bacterium]